MDADPQAASLRRRHFFWGLSMGIPTVAAAGVFWLVRAALFLPDVWGSGSQLHGSINGRAFAQWGALIAIPTLAILLGGRSVRRKAAGFSWDDLRRPELADEVRKGTRAWRWNSVAQTLGCALSGGLGWYFHREDLIWPGIALVVSLHFVTFGRPYLINSVVGTMVATAALLLPVSMLSPASRSIFLGVGMGAVNWATAAYLIVRAESLAPGSAERPETLANAPGQWA